MESRMWRAWRIVGAEEILVLILLFFPKKTKRFWQLAWGPFLRNVLARGKEEGHKEQEQRQPCV